MCSLKLKDPELPAELWDASNSDDDRKYTGPVEGKHDVFLPGYIRVRQQLQDMFQSGHNALSQLRCKRLAKITELMMVQFS